MDNRTFLLWTLAAGCAAAGACSGGDSTATTFTPLPTGGGGMSLGGAGAGASPGSSSGQSSSSGGGASSSSSASSSSAASSSSTSASSSSSTSSSSSGAGTSCDAPADCSSAVLLSSVDGDQNMDTRTLSGSTSRWLKVLVNDSLAFSINGHESYTATLKSPPGMPFDLYVYTGDASTPNCLATPVLGSGTPEAVSDQWPDVILQDDSRWITFEVRSVSGLPCTPSAQWTFTVVGNTEP